jgi:hypothetical protein
VRIGRPTFERFPEESGLATEALIAAVDDGRLDSARLTEALEQLLSVGLAKPERLARTLGAANVSVLHTEFLCGVVERLVRRPPSRTHREMLPVLELFKELLIAAGEAMAEPATRDYLAGLCRRDPGLSMACHPQPGRTDYNQRATHGDLPS